MSFTSTVKGIFGSPNPEPKKDHSQPDAGAYVHNLRVLSDIIERQLLYPAGQTIPVVLDPLTIDQLTKSRTILSPNPVGWAAIDEAELRLFSIMPGGLLKVELATQVARAEILGVIGLDNLKAQFENASQPMNDEDMRHCGVALLQRMYNRYDERRLDRAERRKVDGQMLVTTLSLLSAFLIVVAVLIYAGVARDFNPLGLSGPLPPTNPPVPPSLGAKAMRGMAYLSVIHLWVVPYFGMIGAMFSRFIEYRTKRSTMGREELWSGYSLSVTWGRLMIGALAALLFFFIMAGNLLNGQMFIDGNTNFLIPSDNSANFPTTAFFRLVIWSAIAGFAEKLVPERFDELVSTAKTKDAAKDTDKAK